jgi:hypothetical protein
LKLLEAMTPIYTAAAALALLPFLLATPAHATPFQEASCHYDNGTQKIVVDGPCTIDDTTINGHFAYIVTFKGGVKVTVEYLNSSGSDHLWKINGQSGWGFEINREHLHGATLDLNQSIDWEDNAPTNDTTKTNVGQLAEQIPAEAESRLPQCGTADAQAMATSAIENSPNNPRNIKVLDFKDFDPEKAARQSPEMLQAVINLEGLAPKSSNEMRITVTNTPVERHCFAIVVTNAGQQAVRYRFFFSSKHEPLVEVTPLRL